MRACIRCRRTMVEGLQVSTNEAYGLCVKEKGFFKGSLGKIVCAVCPGCGYIEMYIENTEKLNKAIERSEGIN